MTAYRRARQAGGCYLFTVALADRRSGLLVEKAEHPGHCFRRVRARHPFVIDAIMVLPDHLHCIWSLPENDADFGLRWSLIKASFSRGVENGERDDGKAASTGANVASGGAGSGNI